MALQIQIQHFIPDYSMYTSYCHTLLCKTLLKFSRTSPKFQIQNQKGTKHVELHLYVNSYIRCFYIFVDIYGQRWGFPGCHSGKENVCQCRRHNRHGFDPWVGKIPWRRAWQPISIILPGECHGQRSLVDYSPKGCKESDRTETSQHKHTETYRVAIKSGNTGEYINILLIL